MEFSKSKFMIRIKWILPVAAGAAGGYAYYALVGCLSGTCPISSNPWLMTGYGALMGLIAAPWGTKQVRESQGVG